MALTPKAETDEAATVPVKRPGPSRYFKNDINFSIYFG